jgi:hypothetical protein
MGCGTSCVDGSDDDNCGIDDAFYCDGHVCLTSTIVIQTVYKLETTLE